jgi:hypothetical protein
MCLIQRLATKVVTQTNNTNNTKKLTKISRKTKQTQTLEQQQTITRQTFKNVAESTAAQLMFAIDLKLVGHQLPRDVAAARHAISASIELRARAIGVRRRRYRRGQRCRLEYLCKLSLRFYCNPRTINRPHNNHTHHKNKNNPPPPPPLAVIIHPN